MQHKISQMKYRKKKTTGKPEIVVRA